MDPISPFNLLKRNSPAEVYDLYFNMLRKISSNYDTATSKINKLYELQKIDFKYIQSNYKGINELRNVAIQDLRDLIIYYNKVQENSIYFNNQKIDLELIKDLPNIGKGDEYLDCHIFSQKIFTLSILLFDINIHHLIEVRANNPSQKSIDINDHIMFLLYSCFGLSCKWIYDNLPGGVNNFLHAYLKHSKKQVDPNLLEPGVLKNFEMEILKSVEHNLEVHDITDLLRMIFYYVKDSINNELKNEISRRGINRTSIDIFKIALKSLLEDFIETAFVLNVTSYQRKQSFGYESMMLQINSIFFSALIFYIFPNQAHYQVTNIFCDALKKTILENNVFKALLSSEYFHTIVNSITILPINIMVQIFPNLVLKKRKFCTKEWDTCSHLDMMGQYFSYKLFGRNKEHKHDVREISRRLAKLLNGNIFSTRGDFFSFTFSKRKEEDSKKQNETNNISKLSTEKITARINPQKRPNIHITVTTSSEIQAKRIRLIGL